MIPSPPLLTDGGPHLCFAFQAAEISADLQPLLRLSLWFLTPTLFSLEFVLKNYVGDPSPGLQNPNPSKFPVQHVLAGCYLPLLLRNSNRFQLSSFNSGTIWGLVLPRKMLCCRS